MALIDMGRTRGHSVSLAGMVHSVSTTLHNWNDQRRTAKLLSQLTDAELDDIGLARHDIDRIARQPRF